MLENVRRSQPQLSSRPDHLADEFGETLRLAVPMMLTQLGQIAMMTTDLALIGRLGEDAVAAAALAHTVYFISFTFGLGLVAAVAPATSGASGGPCASACGSRC
jgi:multidrug resistance protein, MATE family